MKNRYLQFIFAFTIIFFSACSEDEDTAPVQDNIIPDRFKIDIPSSISSANSGGKLASNPDSIYDVSWIYGGLPHFIQIGEGSADIVSAIISSIYKYNLAQAQSFDFTSDDDGRVKELVIKENSLVNGLTYQFGMQIKDKADDAVAMQVFWNNNPIEGFAVMNVYQMNRVNNDSSTLNTFYKVRYSENIPNFDAEMEVWISGASVDPVDTFDVDGLRMRVTKIGNIVTVYGNSNHPQFQFSNGTSGIIGRNYAFRARGDEANEIGVAEVALPPSNVSTITNLYTSYNILEVCKIEYGTAVESILFNYKAPGYFSETGGFLGDGDYNADPQLWSAVFIDLTALDPFIPSDIRDLVIDFESF